MECSMHGCHNIATVLCEISTSEGELRSRYYACDSCYDEGIEPLGVMVPESIESILDKRTT